jgi:hypothetical protein
LIVIDQYDCNPIISPIIVGPAVGIYSLDKFVRSNFNEKLKFNCGKTNRNFGTLDGKTAAECAKPLFQLLSNDFKNLKFKVKILKTDEIMIEFEFQYLNAPFDDLHLYPNLIPYVNMVLEKQYDEHTDVTETVNDSYEDKGTNHEDKIDIKPDETPSGRQQSASKLSSSNHISCLEYYRYDIHKYMNRLAKHGLAFTLGVHRSVPTCHYNLILLLMPPLSHVLPTTTVPQLIPSSFTLLLS